MRFIKLEHYVVHGHAVTLREGRLLLQRLQQRRFIDEEKNGVRQRFFDAAQAFEGGEVEECRKALEKILDCKGLPEEIEPDILPILVKLKDKKPDRTAYVHYQRDLDCDLQLVEDGHDRAAPDPENPTCTIVFRNGQWRNVLGTADQVVARLLNGNGAT